MIKKIFLILFVLFSCSNEISNQSNPDNISLFVITEDITLGENRVVYTVLDKEGNNISENMNFKLKKIDDSKEMIIDDYELVDWPGNRSVFKSDIAFDSTGYWEIIGEYKKSNTKGVIEVKEISSTLNTGEKVSSIKTPSLENKKIIDLSTDIEPDINLYSHSLDIALEKKVPIIVVPSTYCKVKESDLIKAGVNVVIYANHLMRSAYPAMVKTAKGILKEESSEKVSKEYCMPIKEILELIPGGKYWNYLKRLNLWGIHFLRVYLTAL